IKAGRSTFRLPYFKKDEFIFEEPNDNSDIAMPLNENLIEGFRACLVTASKDQAQAALMGIAMRQEKQVMLYSTDGDALTRYNLKLAGDQGVPNYTMPSEFCESVIKVATDTEAKGGELAFIDGKWARAIIDNSYVIYGLLVTS